MKKNMSVSAYKLNANNSSAFREDGEVPDVTNDEQENGNNEQENANEEQENANEEQRKANEEQRKANEEQKRKEQEQRNKNAANKEDRRIHKQNNMCWISLGITALLLLGTAILFLFMKMSISPIFAILAGLLAIGATVMAILCFTNFERDSWSSLLGDSGLGVFLTIPLVLVAVNFLLAFFAYRRFRS